MFAHAFFPQIPQSLLPVIVKALGNLIQLRVCQRLDLLPQLWQSELRLRFAVRMVKDMHQWPDHSAEAVYKARILAFQGCHNLLLLCRYMAGLLQEAPTQGPSLLGQCSAGLILLGFTACLALPA